MSGGGDIGTCFGCADCPVNCFETVVFCSQNGNKNCCCCRSFNPSQCGDAPPCTDGGCSDDTPLQKYSCVSGSCVQSITGTFTTLQDCQSNCSSFVDCCEDAEICGSESCPCSDCNYDLCCCLWLQSEDPDRPCNVCTPPGPKCTAPICPSHSEDNIGCVCTPSFAPCVSDCISAGGSASGCVSQCISICKDNAKWRCDPSKGCLQDPLFGGFDTLEDCQLNSSGICKQTLPQAHNCVNGRCIGPFETGEFVNLAACLLICGSWSCTTPQVDRGVCEFNSNTEINPAIGQYINQNECETSSECTLQIGFDCVSGIGCVQNVGGGQYSTLQACRQEGECGSFQCNGGPCIWKAEEFGGDLYSDLASCQADCSLTFCCSQNCPCTGFCSTNVCGQRTAKDCQGRPTFNTLEECKQQSDCCGDSRHWICENIPGQSGDEPGTKQCTEKIGPKPPSDPNAFDTLQSCNANCGKSWYCRTCQCVKDIGLNGSLSQPICDNACPDFGYRCDSGKCIQDVCGGGMTLDQCKDVCFRWRCDFSTSQTTATPCTKYPDTLNGFLDHTDCLANTVCNITPRYKCVTTQQCPNGKPLAKTCIETFEESAPFTSITQCQESGCGNPDTSVTYNCENNRCNPVNYCDDNYPGTFTDLTGPTGCQQNCWGWGCNSNLCSQEEGVSINRETCASNCHCKWKKHRLTNGCSVCTKLCGRELGADNTTCDEWGANCSDLTNYFDTEQECKNNIYNNFEGRFACVKGGTCSRLEDVADQTSICGIYCNSSQCATNCKGRFGYNCVSGVCRSTDGCTAPEYGTLEDCNKVCGVSVPVGYNCELKNTIEFGTVVKRYTCVPSLIQTDEGIVSQTVPEFPTLALCKTFCLNIGFRGWYCSGNDCVLAKTQQETSGKVTFATYAECAGTCVVPNQSPCGNSFSPDSNRYACLHVSVPTESFTCIPTINGPFITLQECQSQCTKFSYSTKVNNS